MTSTLLIQLYLLGTQYTLNNLQVIQHPYPGLHQVSIMPVYTGSCYCRNIQYTLALASPDDARTSLCHCHNCKVRGPSQLLLHCISGDMKISSSNYLPTIWHQKAFGTNYGLTSKVPKDSFSLITGNPKEHVSDNGSGVLIYREFCDNCGSYILEYGVCSFSIDMIIYLPMMQLTHFLDRKLPKIFSDISVQGPQMIPRLFHLRESSFVDIGLVGCQKSLVSCLLPLRGSRVADELRCVS